MAEKLSFGSDVTGRPPAGWTATKTGTGDPKWTVDEDASAPSGAKVVKQSGRATYPLLLKDGTSVRDGAVEVQFKAISGSEDRAGGLVWRAKDANNYYVVRANALENNVVLYKVQDGRRTDLPLKGEGRTYGRPSQVPTGQWGTLRVVAKGPVFEVYHNNVKLYEVEDRTFTQPGKVGVWTKADSVTQFDDLTVSTK